MLDDLFAQCDVVVQTDPVPFDIIGLPEIAFPIGFQPHAASGREVPIGAILGGLPYAEDRLLASSARTRPSPTGTCGARPTRPRSRGRSPHGRG